ncbi:MAG: molybdopterin molybdenumtransferase MoeA [Nitrospiraceae bacterium]|nr:MAG: molybdopterin molybdenumtransferase MoeA [Nitrospiraceae bacterium]
MKDLLGRDEAVTVEEALRLLAEQDLRLPGTESVHIEKAYGRVLAQDIVSPENLPGFNRSSMDGYAVNAADTFSASDTMPVYLQIKGQVLMGEKACIQIQREEACRIPTGGMLPEGADAVVMFEHTNLIDGETVEIMKTVSPGENVIRFDEDVRAGETVLSTCHRLRPQDIGALAGLGIPVVSVYKKPVVAIVSTGDEVVSPDKPLSPGEVRDINSYNLAGMILACHAHPAKKGIIKDRFDELRAAVSEAVHTSDMVLITGGSSVGTSDYTAKVISGLGSPGVIFHGVAMKPGKPVIGGNINGVPVFGLPGHPAAITVSFETFIEPLIQRLSGKKTNNVLPSRRMLKALFSRNLSSPAGREEHIRVTIERRNGALRAVPVLGKSGLVSTLVRADGIVIIPMNKSGLYEGEEVEVRLFRD